MADNFFTRASIAGVPNYVWLVGGGAALLIWRQRSGSGSSSSNAQAQQQAQQQEQQMAALQQEQAALAAYPSAGGGGSQPIVVLGGDGSGTPTPSTPAQTAPTPQPSANLFSGQVGSGAGQFGQVPNVNSNEALLKAGVTQYQEVTPGQFVPVTATSTYQGNQYALESGITPYTYVYNS